MNHQEALRILKTHIKNPNLIKHSLAVEAVMKKLAEHFNKREEKEKWALCGLLHDLDWERTQNNPQLHGLKAVEILEKQGLDKDILQAIKVHNHLLGFEPKTLMEKALYCAEELTGLITATALVHPQKLAGLNPESVMKKFREKSFARGVNREIIAKAPEMIGLSLEELTRLSLEAMKEIREKLGL